MRKFIPAIVVSIVLLATTSIASYHPYNAYAQEAGAQSVHFEQKKSGDSQFPETGFSAFGIVNCPDGRAQANYVTFGFTALKSGLDGSINGAWGSSVFAVGRSDTGAIDHLNVNASQFEAKGNWTAGFVGSNKTNQTAIICDGMPLDNTAVTISGACGQDVNVNFAASNGITGRFLGNATCTAGDTSRQYTLKVNALELGSTAEPLAGMWATVRAENGTPLASGFTPFAFTGTSSAIYRVTVADYAGIKFDGWQDTTTLWGGDSRNSTRTVVLSSDMTIVAGYRPEINLAKGFTELANDAAPPALTVQAKSLDGNQTLNMWTIIRHPSATSSQPYTVYMHDYKGFAFDHWDDGSTNRVRMLDIVSNTTITAYYSTG